jgi:multidrug efflux pump subunit AcrA (membrane-fusion protein)
MNTFDFNALVRSMNMKDIQEALDTATKLLAEEQERERKAAEEAERKRKIAAAEAARNAQSAREAIAAKTFVGKTLYGEYNPADNGFEHEWLTNAPKDSSQVKIDTTAETSADFTVMPGLVFSQVNIVVGACEIVAGNISDYNSYAVKEPGRLTLDERTQVWKIEKPVKIELIK